MAALRFLPYSEEVSLVLLLKNAQSETLHLFTGKVGRKTWLSSCSPGHRAAVNPDHSVVQISFWGAGTLLTAAIETELLTWGGDF